MSKRTVILTKEQLAIIMASTVAGYEGYSRERSMEFVKANVHKYVAGAEAVLSGAVVPQKVAENFIYSDKASFEA